ncbi:MAG: hypothetical protein AB1391_03660 [Candidatus Micrarchaeota archaeon]
MSKLGRAFIKTTTTTTCISNITRIRSNAGYFLPLGDNLSSTTTLAAYTGIKIVPKIDGGDGGTTTIAPQGKPLFESSLILKSFNDAAEKKVSISLEEKDVEKLKKLPDNLAFVIKHDVKDNNKPYGIFRVAKKTQGGKTENVLYVFLLTEDKKTELEKIISEEEEKQKKLREKQAKQQRTADKKRLPELLRKLYKSAYTSAGISLAAITTSVTWLGIWYVLNESSAPSSFLNNLYNYGFIPLLFIVCACILKSSYRINICKILEEIKGMDLKEILKQRQFWGTTTEEGLLREINQIVKAVSLIWLITKEPHKKIAEFKSFVNLQFYKIGKGIEKIGIGLSSKFQLTQQTALKEGQIDNNKKENVTQSTEK